MKIQIRIYPTKEQEAHLLNTIKEANAACNEISAIVFHKQMFHQFSIHKECYYLIRGKYKLTSQMVVRCISKVANSYKSNNSIKTEFKPFGCINYDSRILSYNENIISICTIGGRIKMPFTCHKTEYLKYINGECHLSVRNRKFYLLQSCEIPAIKTVPVNEIIGCDFGQTNICTLSDGTNYSSKDIKAVRAYYTKVRASVQRKGTKGAKRLLKRLSGRERRFVAISNHKISKQIVEKAKTSHLGIAIEDLTNIRKTARVKSRKQKIGLNNWSFSQLRQFITYKAELNGVKLFVIPPAYTSQMCNVCLHIGNRDGKQFSCFNCGNISDADHNAAKNIATWGCVVNQPEKSDMLSCSLRV